MTAGPALVEIDHADAARPGQDPVLRGVSWTVRAGEAWAVVGPTASGKSSLLQFLAGGLRRTAGSIRWPILERERALDPSVHLPSQVVRVVGFREESRLFAHANHYYQQRFNIIDPLEDVSLGHYLSSSLPPGSRRDDALLDRLRIAGLEGRSLLHLSNGQMRLARLARTLFAGPKLLCLDEPFMGLDEPGRAELSEVLGELVAAGLNLVIVTRPEWRPGWVGRSIHLEGGGVVGFDLPPPRVPARRIADVRVERPPDADAPEVIGMDGVTVRYGETTILDGIDWRVRAGERWAVFGGNGSGKSTLLSLVAGDHPQRYSNAIRLFGRPRRLGDTIWQLKHRLGLVSPEFHLYFTEPLTALQVVGTGFADGVVAPRLTAEQRARALEVLGQFGVDGLAAQPFRQLSTGEQRLALLARSVVKSPELLIWDEPYQGLDAAGVRRGNAWLREHLAARTALLFVTHDAGEVPEGLAGIMRLGERGASAP